MVPLDHVLAVALLAAPGDVGPLTEHAGLTRTLQVVCLGWELLDPREASYVLVRPADFVEDVQLARRRYHELIDAPPLADALRFPHRELVCELLGFNRAYHTHLTRYGEAVGSAAADLEAARREADRLYHVYDLVRDARSEFYYVSVRRQALASLREVVGRDAYYGGTLPPHVPVWRFARRD